MKKERRRKRERERDRRWDRRIKLISIFFQDILWKLHAVHQPHKCEFIMEKRRIAYEKKWLQKKTSIFQSPPCVCVCDIHEMGQWTTHYSTSWSFMNFSSNHDCFCWCSLLVLDWKWTVKVEWVDSSLNTISVIGCFDYYFLLLLFEK